MSTTRKVLVGLLAVPLVAVGAFYARYGGSGADFPKLADATPLQQAELIATLDEPPGNLAVSASGRIFFTHHAEGRPVVKVLELVDGKGVPYPSAEAQQSEYGDVFSLRIDAQNRLWSVDHGFHGVRGAKVVAVDLGTNTIVKRLTLPSEVAGLGSYVQDFQVDAAGHFLYLADIGVLDGHPGLIVLDTQTGAARRLLDSHPALMPEPYTINAQGRRMVLLGGLFWLHPAFDPIALDRRGEWLYVGAMASKSLWRVRVADLQDIALSAAQLAAKVERYADKPQCDGLTIDAQDTVYLTGVEDGVVWSLDAQKRLTALAGHPKLRWPDGLSFGPDNFIYVADSDIPDVMLKSRAHIQAAGPFHLFRFKATGTAPAGQ
jgi:hypothetical protein